MYLSADPEAYYYLAQSGCTSIPGKKEEDEFQEMYDAMKDLNLKDEQIDGMFRIPAAILHLGNVKFASQKDGEASSIDEQSTESVTRASNLLGTPLPILQRALVQSTFTSGSRRASITTVDLNPSKARDNRDALCKVLYTKLFDYIVWSVNQAMCLGKAETQPQSKVLFVQFLR